MRFEVILTASAVRDLELIHEYVVQSGSVAAGERLLDQMLALIEKLETHPDRGSIPPELLDLGVRDFRQLHFKVWRVIYRTLENRVEIRLIADGRRDMVSLLAQRLFST